MINILCQSFPSKFSMTSPNNRGLYRIQLARNKQCTHHFICRTNFYQPRASGQWLKASTAMYVHVISKLQQKLHVHNLQIVNTTYSKHSSSCCKVAARAESSMAACMCQFVGCRMMRTKIHCPKVMCPGENVK